MKSNCCFFSGSELAKAVAGVMFFLWGATSHADPAVKVRGIVGAAEKPQVVQVFAERPVELALDLSAEAVEAPISFRAKVYQLASSIAAPLGEELPVAQELSFERPSTQSQSWKFIPPAVTRVTRFELRFAWQKKGAPEWRPAGNVRLIVYPENLEKELKKFAQASEEQGLGRIAVFGPSETLKAALQGVGVEFKEAGERVPDEPEAGTIYLGEGRAEELDSLTKRPDWHGRIMLFTSDPASLPGVYWTEYPAGFLAKVNLPLLTDFAQSPASQMGLLNLLNRAVRPHPNTP